MALSILIAALASYTALDLATRMRAASGRARPAWLAAAATAMGGGIWSMHFVGMLAFRLPGVEISYDPFLTFLSLVVPIVVAAAAFAVVGRRPQALLVSGLAMGLGISGMHYTGMRAMRMAASVAYDPRWVVLSVVIAMCASVVALWLAFRKTMRRSDCSQDLSWVSRSPACITRLWKVPRSSLRTPWRDTLDISWVGRRWHFCSPAPPS